MAQVLILEPDSKLGHTYKKAIEFAGHEVIRLSDAQSAIYAIDKKMPDIIITELYLPGHGGVEFMYELRSYAEWQNIPVIVLGNVHPSKTEILTAMRRQLNISSYHYKPITRLEHLIHEVNKLTLAAAV